MDDQDEIHRAVVKILNESDETLVRIAVQFGFSSDAAVRRIAKHEGVDLAARLKARRQAKKTRIIDALNVTSNAAHVARRLGYSRPLVFKVAKDESFKLTDGQAAKGQSRSRAKHTTVSETPTPSRRAPAREPG